MEKNFIIYAVAKELGYSKKFKEYINELAAEHKEMRKEYEKSNSDAPRLRGYIRINNERLMDDLTRFAETPFLLGIIFKAWKDNILDEEDLKKVASLLENELGKNGVDVRYVHSNDNDVRLYYNEDYLE